MPRLGPGGASGGDNANEIPAGEYIIALKSFKRAKAKSSGNEYLRCTWVICAGPLEGKRFYSNVSLDLSKEGSVNRWRIWMEACGVEDEFELGSTDEGTQAEGDRNIRELFVGQPFVATIKVERNGQYTNHDIDRIHYVRLWTQEHKDAMDRWLETQQSAGQPGGKPEVGDNGQRGGGGQADDWTRGGDDQDYGQVGGGTQTGGFAGGGDDDIPF
jgi:hypothetical protein